EQSFQDNQDFTQSIKDALLIVLTSPQFLFLIENSNTPKPEPISEYELASKLSYFLWNRAPDDRLLELAVTNTLTHSLATETNRLIQDSRFSEFAAEFTTQWLDLDKLAVVEIDRKQYPNLTRDTKVQLGQEPIQFLQYLIQHNLPLQNLIRSDFIMANEAVASYYGLGESTESGFEFLPLSHDNEHLGGILSQAGILAGLSDGRESNPVKRGAWVARKIIAQPPADPPPNVPDLEQDNSNLTLAERLLQHRNQAGCIKCHQGIDPWGLPFETFDAGGLFKTTGKMQSLSTLPDKTIVDDLDGLKQYLVNQQLDQVTFSFLKHLSSYAIGRSLSYNEIVELKENQLELRASGYQMQDLFRFVITSELFLNK
ncbi:MAG: DUF1592 domain-containing protein, partial [Planctomycetaceae bacterium]|nr:DUF1592 domain-containing protein [Planctomycetaceae bacterium]